MDGVQVYVQTPMFRQTTLCHQVQSPSGRWHRGSPRHLPAGLHPDPPRDRNGDYLATVELTSIVNAKLAIWDG